MSEEYILARDIIYDHNERMLNIKKYYPFFRLSEVSFSQFQGGRYSKLDMGYLMMAVLRFFIEENNFKEKDVKYEEYAAFMQEVLKRDFDIIIQDKDAADELVAFIFDKLKNDGKPFTYEYFDPTAKKKKSIRMKIIDSRIMEDTVYYYITSDAIEFYLDTKEIKDESTISIQQVLLEKMISTNNFKGGAEVIRRINNEVSKLKFRKNEVLNILSHDVFEGMKAYEDFTKTGIRWFDEEQKLFIKNKELIDKALEKAEENENSASALEDMYYLETELKKAIMRHSELLRACTDLQVKADDIVRKAKFKRLRSAFDFENATGLMLERDDTTILRSFIVPMLKLNVAKTLSLTAIDKMLTIRPDNEEIGEKINDDQVEEMYVYDDEIEEERIKDNYSYLIQALLDYILEYELFTLREFNEYLEKRFSKELFRNGDYYSFLVHMCQKKQYKVSSILVKPDTFFEKYLSEAAQEERYRDIAFTITMDDNDRIEMSGINYISNIIFERNGSR